MQSKDSGVTERRASERYGLELAIAFRRLPILRDNAVLDGQTRNISTGGMYFTTAESLALNEVLDFSLTFSGLVRGADVFVIGRARVLRVMHNSETTTEPTGVAVLTEEYHIVEPDAVA